MAGGLAVGFSALQREAEYVRSLFPVKACQVCLCGSNVNIPGFTVKKNPKTAATIAWGEALTRHAIQAGLEPSAPGGGWWAELAEERIREKRWVTRQSSWHRQERPRP
jgi:hypothetical protein